MPSTAPLVTLDDVTLHLPDERLLFRNLSLQLDRRSAGLVGRNGTGKTALARLIAGHYQPSAGRVTVSGTVFYLAQEISPSDYRDVADVAGVRAALDALARIEAGTGTPEDFDVLGDRWDLRDRFRELLARFCLGHLAPDTPACWLSGGECTRVALLGAWLTEPDLLILDEPTNHLDSDARTSLREQLTAWRGGLLVISHDRELLNTLQRIIELSPAGCRDYGGNYSFYADCRRREREAAEHQLQHARLERRRLETELRARHERQQRRQARGQRDAAGANQAKILLGRQRERSEHTAGRLQRQHEQLREQHARKIAAAVQSVVPETPIALQPPHVQVPATKTVARLEAVKLPFGPCASRHIDLSIIGPRRLAVTGPNGCGKSTLLKLLAGRLLPAAGRCEISVPVGYLDQQLGELDPDRSALAILTASPGTPRESELRTRLAQAGITAERALLPVRLLSGGERMKVALVSMLTADPPVQLLLLDEPTNHLDLESVQALESMLLGYRGALVVVSHDTVFLRSLGPTRRLRWSPEGWCEESWSD